MRVGEATPSSMMKRTALACHCVSQPCTMFSILCGTLSCSSSIFAMSIHAPAVTPAAGSTHDGSRMLLRRQSPGHKARSHVSAPSRLAFRANMKRHTPASTSTSTRKKMNDGHPKRIPSAPSSQLPNPISPKVAGKLAAAAAGSFAPATQATMSPGRVNTAMASQTAPTTSMRPYFLPCSIRAVYSTSFALRRSLVTNTLSPS